MKWGENKRGKEVISDCQHLVDVIVNRRQEIGKEQILKRWRKMVLCLDMVQIMNQK